MKIVVLGIIVSVIVSSCLKDQDDAPPCTPKTVESEIPAMAKFATDSSIVTSSDVSGVQYQVITQGAGPTPTINSTIKAKYTGRLLNGQQFDASNGVDFLLKGVIEGWQIGIPKINEGGRIKLLIPSSLAYGCNPYYGVLANQPLYFDIELLKVTN